MMIMYGIPNCDTIKKARIWLEAHKVEYAFHDYKKAGIDTIRLEGWVKQAGWEVLLNRTGTTFKKLPEADKRNLTAEKAIALMLANPSIIKRPLLERKSGITAGFKPEIYATLF